LRGKGKAGGENTKKERGKRITPPGNQNIHLAGFISPAKERKKKGVIGKKKEEKGG